MTFLRNSMQAYSTIIMNYLTNKPNLVKVLWLPPNTPYNQY